MAHLKNSSQRCVQIRKRFYPLGELILNLTEAPGNTTPSSMKSIGKREGMFCIFPE